ncbi:MAG: response regulator [Candidatus Eremiobacterota bacterium]
MNCIENSKIMIIDDQPSNLSVMYEYLNEFNTDLMLIQKGQEGIEIAELKKPDVILLDIIMPDMNGFEVCKKLKENKNTADIPVIFMSCLTDTDNIVKGFELGGIDYITKPVRREEVIARISTHLKIRRTEESLKKYSDHLEELVEKRTAELKDTCEKLEREVAEHRKLEGQLIQSQKMEAIGTLAGGIAHDFNNILGSIIGYTELALFEISEEHIIYQYLSQVLKAGDRAKELVAQILTFSRRTDQKRKLLNIIPVIKEAVKLLRASLPATIEIRQDIKGKQAVIMADPTQIHQIILNLCTNGAHAMKERGGILDISLADVDIFPEDLPFYTDIKTGPYVKLTVSDTGHGIKREVLERIFEPYFTTKETGEGTGLGLSVVHGIVTGYGGNIKVYSEPGKGTEFQVLLPKIKTDEDITHEKLETIPGGTGTILVVDDEEAIVNIMKSMLKRLGYEVITEIDSIKALESFRNAPHHFDLVITDLTMPHMTGRELAKEIMCIRADIPVILTTGFSDTINPDEEIRSGIKELLLKPVTIRNLAETVKKLLGMEIYK